MTGEEKRPLAIITGVGPGTGSALVRRLQARGYHNLITRTRAELDLVEARSVREFFGRERPEVVLLAAAKVGGILANNTYPAQFIQENLAIQTNVVAFDQKVIGDAVRHELERGSVVVVQPGTILQLRNAGEDELVLFIYGAPPEQGGAEFFESVP